MTGNVTVPGAPGRRAQAKGEDFAHSRQFEWLARAGLVSRGVIYAIIGVLAIKLALGDGPESTDDTKERVAGAVSGIAYGAVFVTAVSILLGSGGGSGSPDKATGGVLGWPGGQVLVAIAGVVMIGVGLAQGYKGIKLEFLEKSKTEQMSDKVEMAFTFLGVLGHLARMVVFGLIGYFLIRAAIDYNPDKAVGLDGALAALRRASYGPALLGIVAAGLIAFAAYSVSDARYRRV